MSITIDPELEADLRSQAHANGLTVDAYLASLVRADLESRDELEALAPEGLNSGEPFEPGPGYWEQKHRLLDERMKTR